MTQLNQFNGGLNEVSSPNLLLVNQGIQYENIDISSGVLRPTLKEELTDVTYCRSMYYFKGAWITPIDCSKEYHYVEYNNSLYCNDMEGKISYTTDGINWNPLVITEAPTAPTVKGNSATIPSATTDRIFYSVRSHPDETYIYPTKQTVFIYDFNATPILDPALITSVQISIAKFGSTNPDYVYSFTNFSNRYVLDSYTLEVGERYSFTITILGTGITYTDAVFRLCIANTAAVPTEHIKLYDVGTVDADSANYSYMDTTEPVIFTSNFESDNGETHLATEYTIVKLSTMEEVYYNIDYNNLTLIVIKAPFELEPNTGYSFRAVHIGSAASRSNMIDFRRFTAGKGTTQAPVATGGLTGTYTYVYTYYNSSNGYESPPSPQSASVTITNGNIEISGFVPSLTKGVDKILLYRLGGSLVNYARVAMLSNNALSYTDDQSDLDIDGDILATAGTTGNIQLKYIREVNSMLIGAWGNKLYYSDVAYVNRWRQLQFIGYSFEITGIATSNNGILVFGFNKTYIVTGTTPEAFANYLISGSQGCINYYSIQSLNNSILFCSNDGICATTGGDISVISKTLLKHKIASTDIKSSCIFNDEYYLFFASKYIIFNGGTFRNETVEFTISNSHYAGEIDRLFIGGDNKVYEKILDQEVIADSFHKARTAIKNLKYKSPVYSENSLLVSKYWKTLLVYAVGNTSDTSDLSVIMDNVTVVNTTLKFGFNEIKLPQSSTTRGIYIQFTIVGKLEILEVTFSAERSKNDIPK